MTSPRFARLFALALALGATAALAPVAAQECVPETCNGLDDDCDGPIDEDFTLLGQPCDNGQTGVCHETGVYVCHEGGLSEKCSAPTVQPAEEICNGLDDDCDGTTDEDFPTLGDSCDNGQVGACFREGAVVCAVDGSAAQCDAEAVEPAVEICNEVDDDCDGETDEDGVCDAEQPIFADDFEDAELGDWSYSVAG